MFAATLLAVANIDRRQLASELYRNESRVFTHAFRELEVHKTTPGILPSDQCRRDYCTSIGNDCCAPGDQKRTCSNGFVSVNLEGSCNGWAHSRYTCCPPENGVCDESYCTSPGNDCCAPGTQVRTCSNGYDAVDVQGACFPKGPDAKYTCCPPGTKPTGVSLLEHTRLPNWHGKPKFVPQTHVDIQGEKFYLNGRPTWQGQKWRGHSIEGLLFNSRMVQGVFDDMNVKTRWRWSYPDGSDFDPQRNSEELRDQLTHYAASGLNAITIGMQGASPCGSSWPCDAAGLNERDFSGFAHDGSLRIPFFERMGMVIEEADRLGMVIIMQFFYLDQLIRIFNSNDDILRACDHATDWLLDRGYTNVVLDVANENDFCGRAAWDMCGEHGAAMCCWQHKFTSLHWPPHGHHDQLLERIRKRGRARGVKLLISASYCGGHVPHSSDLPSMDFINLHGNNLWQPAFACREGHAGCAQLGKMVDIVRRFSTFRSHPKPILVSEDDGRCLHDGISVWTDAKSAMMDKSKFGPDHTGPACFFDFDACSPSRSSRCALGQAIAARISWGL